MKTVAKITDLKTFIMHGVERNWLFVKIETDAGVHGWGEASLEQKEKTVETAMRRYSKAVRMKPSAEAAMATSTMTERLRICNSLFCQTVSRRVLKKVSEGFSFTHYVSV
ncbi:MAG: hypothetical protein O7E52_13945 [Candidatus Poribacteria bacterium]|nr:hypothetical protein [Candidatus Poribacteria bacterium]